VSLSVCVSLSECVFVSFSQYAWITLSVSVCVSFRVFLPMEKEVDTEGSLCSLLYPLPFP